jgi:prophage antirepressor-like protein
MSNLTIFNFHQSQVRIQLLNNEPLFCLTDVTNILNVKNANASRFNMSEAGIHKMYIRSGGQNREVTFINEPNLYRVIFRSNKKEAVDFQNWVFEEVLPTLRKTGSYSLKTNATSISPNRELLPKMVYHNKSAHKPYRAYVYDMSLKKEVSVGTFATVEEALAAQKNYFQTKPFKTAPIPAHGRWLAISDSNGIEVKNIDGYNCVNFKQFRKLQSDARTYAEETIKLLHKIQDLSTLSHEFLYRLKVLEGIENTSRLDTPILDLLKK